MLNIKKVKFSNLLSYGNETHEVALDGDALTLICGKNGSGKSSISTAITFCLFNRVDRDVPKADLVNSITKKGCLVEVDLSNGSEYTITRGVKPNVFKVLRDGVPVEPPADQRAFQDWLEASVIGMSFKTFLQVVSLGSAEYIPFMKLPALQRRSMVEDLLDLGVFMRMNDALRKRIHANDDLRRESEFRRKLASEKSEFLRIRVNDWSADSIKRRRDEVAALKAENERLAETIREIGQLPLPPSTDKLITYRGRIFEKMTSVQATGSFFREQESCPTCGQEITAHLRKERANECDTQVTELSVALSDIDAKLVTCNSMLTETAMKDAKIRATKNRIESNLQLMWRMDTDIEGAVEQRREALAKVTELKNDEKAAEVEEQHAVSEGALLASAQALLKDNGMKARIIAAYVPLLNEFVNRYLAELEFLCEFEMDESFTVTIRSRHRDEFSYWSFSAGERMRIDLAILLAWRDVAQLRNSATTNLLFLDEVMDASLDAEGTDCLLRLLSRGASNTRRNVFVITHSRDALDRSFRCLQVEKRNGFSRITSC